MARQIEPKTRDQAVVDEHRQGLAKGFGYLAHFMGPGPFAVGATPTLGDCAAGPYMMLIKKMIFQIFDDIPDPTLGDGRLATWWSAMQDNEICARTLDEYAAAVDSFMKYVVERVKS
jgi:glutathione S-transferase